MNKEEKKAIKDMDKFANGIDMSGVSASQMQTILNLIAKLQKENEEFKRLHIQDNKHLDFIMQHSIPVQKVKDKIEKLNDESHAEELEDIMIGENYTITELVQYVLQELIEEREVK